MAKRISERERLLNYSYTANKEELEEAVELFRTALRSRFRGAGTATRKGGKRAKPNLPSTAGERPEDGSGTEGRAMAAR